MKNEIARIRNFSIIAHIDHGKSTLADRMLEKTHTVEKRKMHDQVLDQMELEQERGITIKMQPVRMEYSYKGDENFPEGKYIFNLIDTPGHIDFSYEVSRAMKAVEGAILLVDATQGVQAQTLTTLDMARKAGLTIIPALSKVDSPLARVEEVREEIALLLGIDSQEIIETSGKTGEGVEELFAHIIQKIPSPRVDAETTLNSLIFDFAYHDNKGVIVYVRVFSGEVKKTDELFFKVAGRKFRANEVGIFTPFEKEVEKLSAGEIGYIVTGIKEPGVASVGDVITAFRKQIGDDAIEGYEKPKSVVWASVYPESQDDFDFLRTALSKLQLSDSSFSYEEEASGVMGRGFRIGFLGMLHLEILTERLKREFSLNLIITTPSVSYRVMDKRGNEKVVHSAIHFPSHGEVEKVREPWIRLNVITKHEYVDRIIPLLYEYEGILTDTKNFGEDRVELIIEMPLRELMRNFFDRLKSVSSGYASISYEFIGERDADVTKMEILIAEEVVPAFSRVISKRRMREEAEEVVEKLYKALPRQLFVVKIQAKVLGRIIASRKLSALKKDVTAKLYGGDITRKMKLREKQKKGKKRMSQTGKVNISHDVFLKMMKRGD